MRLRFRLLLLFVLPVVLTACVSYSDRLQFVSSNMAGDHVDARNGDHSCQPAEIVTVKNEQQAGLDPDAIAFLNWNIYKGNGDNWQQDLSAYASSHDLMTIQEALLDEELSGLLLKHDFNWVMNAAFQLNGDAAGVMTLANSDVIHSCGYKQNEPLIRIPKATLVSYYAIAGSKEKLLVANIHGINFTFGIDDYQQQLETLYQAIRYHQGPMIVAGDFNSWSEARMAKVMQLVDKLSLSDIEYPVNNKTHFFGMAIDHVFYRQLEAVSNRVMQVTSSDHNPISVTFRVRADNIESVASNL